MRDTVRNQTGRKIGPILPLIDPYIASWVETA